MQFATFFVFQLFPTYQLFHIQSQPNLAAGFPVRVYIPSNRQSTQHYLPHKKHHAACVFHGEVIKFSTITSAVQYNINHDPTGIEWEKREGE